MHRRLLVEILVVILRRPELVRLDDLRDDRRLQLLPQFQSTSVARGRQRADLISSRRPYFASRTIGAAEQDHRLRRGETVRQSTMCPPSQILRRRDAR